MPCRPARSLTILRREIRAAFPNRDEASDGGCASPDHTSRSPNSHHEPNAAGVARAYDFDEDLLGVGYPATEMVAIANHLRRLGINGDPRPYYVIYEGHIASPVKAWAWRPYTGPNAHLHHLHLSVAPRDPAAYDSVAPWGIKELFDQPEPNPTEPPTLQPEDDDMPYIANPVTDNDPGQFLVVGNKRVPLGHPDEAQQFRNSGLPTKDFEPLAWALIKAATTEVPHP